MSTSIASYKNLMEAAYPSSCRVTAKKARGSATIIYSQNGDTYALTNHHVIEGNVEYKMVWDSILKKKVEKEFMEMAEIMFPRIVDDQVVGYSTVLTDIETYDAPQDIALLKFRDTSLFPMVKWCTREKAEKIPHLTSLTCIGAALGMHPIVTVGHLNGKQIEIDNYEYWMSSAPSIFGNSGGGVFALIEKQWQLLGIPSRISVVPMGFSADAVTHMGYFIPINRIYDWLEENVYEFLWDESVSKEDCERRREQKRKKLQKEEIEKKLGES